MERRLKRATCRPCMVPAGGGGRATLEMRRSCWSRCDEMEKRSRRISWLRVSISHIAAHTHHNVVGFRVRAQQDGTVVEGSCGHRAYAPGFVEGVRRWEKVGEGGRR